MVRGRRRTVSYETARYDCGTIAEHEARLAATIVMSRGQGRGFALQPGEKIAVSASLRPGLEC
jgi:hypothetical protein